MAYSSEKSRAQIDAICGKEQRDQKTGAAKDSDRLERVSFDLGT